MVIVQLTNGFGNNIFQIMAGALLATHFKKKLTIVTPTKGYYATRDLRPLGS